MYKVPSLEDKNPGSLGPRSVPTQLYHPRFTLASYKETKNEDRLRTREGGENVGEKAQ